MPRQLQAQINVRYDVRFTVEDDQTIDEVLADIDIPENEECRYVPDSFEIENVEDLDGNLVPVEQWGNDE